MRRARPAVRDDSARTRRKILISTQVDKVKALRAVRPDLHISVDGGVNAKIAPELLRAGANVLVAGGAIFKADDKKTVVAELIGNAPHRRGADIQAADNNSGPGGAASPFEDDACPDA